MKPHIEFVRNNRIAKEVILIDGPPRAGKSMLGPIMSSFDRVEIERMEPFFDSLPVLYSFNKITKDAAIALLRREVDVRLYDSMISRMTNFRFKDRTSVFNTANCLRYIKRMFLKDGDITLERIKRERPVFQIMTHDMLQIIDLYLEAFGEGLRVIEMVRHPVDLVYSMNRRDHGSSIGINPRLWQLSIKSKGGDIPYYAYGWSEEFIKCLPIDRVIKIVQLLTKQVGDKYSQLSQSQKHQVLFIPYEDFIMFTYKYLEQIKNFAGLEFTKYTKRTLKKQKVPNLIDPRIKEKKIKSIREKASKECFEILNSLSLEYENMYFNSTMK